MMPYGPPRPERFRAAIVALFERVSHLTALMALRAWSPAWDDVWIRQRMPPIYYRPPTPPAADLYVPESLDFWAGELDPTKR